MSNRVSLVIEKSLQNCSAVDNSPIWFFAIQKNANKANRCNWGTVSDWQYDRPAYWSCLSLILTASVYCFCSAIRHQRHRIGQLPKECRRWTGSSPWSSSFAVVSKGPAKLSTKVDQAWIYILCIEVYLHRSTVSTVKRQDPVLTTIDVLSTTNQLARRQFWRTNH